MNSQELFVPSTSWQAAPDWATLPAGGEFYNYATRGVLFVRWNPPVPSPEGVIDKRTGKPQTVPAQEKPKPSLLSELTGQSPPSAPDPERGNLSYVEAVNPEEESYVEPVSRQEEEQYAHPRAPALDDKSIGQFSPQEQEQRDTPGDEHAGGETDQEIPIINKLRGAILSGLKLQDVQLPPRQSVIDDWFREGDCGFIFAPRGLGKTWVSLGLAVAITAAGAFGPFQSKVSWPVLYVDGEMPFESIRDRISALHGLCPENLHVLNHDILFQNHEASLNLAQITAQEAVTALCLELGIRVVILDNLSCLFSGLRENDADDWQIVKGWLLKLRRHRIAVIVVHHTGRNSSYMRGTSAREDDVFWVMRLDEPSDAKVGTLNGANFISRFTKLRNAPKEPPWYQWKIEQTALGRVIVTTNLADGDDMIVQWVLDGLTSASDIAGEMGVTKGTISKRATRLIKEGRLKKNGRGYEPGPLEESQW